MGLEEGGVVGFVEDWMSEYQLGGYWMDGGLMDGLE